MIKNNYYYALYLMIYQQTLYCGEIQKSWRQLFLSDGL